MYMLLHRLIIALLCVCWGGVLASLDTCHSDFDFWREIIRYFPLVFGANIRYFALVRNPKITKSTNGVQRTSTPADLEATYSGIVRVWFTYMRLCFKHRFPGRRGV